MEVEVRAPGVNDGTNQKLMGPNVEKYTPVV
jgi:hypothetical protein